MQLIKLNNQVCFPLHHAHQLVMKLYHTDLEKFGISYTQYLILLALFEDTELSIRELSDKIRESIPDIKANVRELEEQGYLILHKEGDEIMKVLVAEYALDLKQEFACVPSHLMEKSGFSIERLIALRHELSELVKHLS